VYVIPMLLYKYLQSNYPIEVTKGGDIAVKLYGIRELDAKTGAWGEKKELRVIQVNGKIEKSGLEWTESWIFECSSEDIVKLDACTELMGKHASPGFTSLPRVGEWYCNVFDWLVVGIRCEGSSSCGYARFFKDGHEMVFELSGLKDLFELAYFIKQPM
jgi:hypothetical protein